MFDLNAPLIEWHFRGLCYLPLRCEWAVHRPTDDKGMPNGRPRITHVLLWLAGADLCGEPGRAITEYVVDSFAQRSSLLLLRHPGGRTVRVEVENAHCTYLLDHFAPGETPDGWPARWLGLRLSPAALRYDGLPALVNFSVFPDGWPTSPELEEKNRARAVELPPSAALAAVLRHAEYNGTALPAPSGPATHQLAELPEEELLPTMRRHGLPPLGVPLSYLPSDDTLRALTVEFGVEFAVIYTVRPDGKKGGYTLYAGGKDTVKLGINPQEYLIKHTHPMGTAKPSKLDVEYLKGQQEAGSKQVKSVILPIGKPRITFNKDTPCVSPNS